MIEKETDLNHFNLVSVESKLGQITVKSDQLKCVVISHEWVLLVAPCYAEVEMDVVLI